MRKKWGNRIGAIVLACALTMSGLPVQSISTSTRKAYAAAKSETEKQDVSQALACLAVILPVIC